jgi:hypothetical protein
LKNISTFWEENLLFFIIDLLMGALLMVALRFERIEIVFEVFISILMPIYSKKKKK